MDKIMSPFGGSASGGKKWCLNIFFALVLLSLLTPFWVFSQMQFPYITSKAFFFRIVIELALPLYTYLIIVDSKLRPKLKNPLNLAVLVFLAINIASAIFGVNYLRSLWGNFERMGGAYYLAHLIALYFYIQVLGQAGEVYLKRFLQSFIVIAVLVTLNGLSGWVGGPVLVQDTSLPARVSSTFGNPIFFASFLIIPMFLAAYFAVSEKNIGLKIYYWTAAALQLIGIYFSGTRGAVVGLIVGLFLSAVFYIIFTNNIRVRRFGLIIIAAFLVLAGGLFFYHNRLPQGSTLFRLANLRDSNTEARLIQWKIALKGFKDKPLLGVGSENYYVISNKYYNPEIYKYDASWFDKPHNFLLEVLTTNGVLGFAAYAAMFTLALYGLWKAYRAELLGLMEMCLLAAAMITYQAQNLFVFDTVSASVAFYSFLGFAAYLWVESSAVENLKSVKNVVSENIATAALVLVSLGMLYVVYVSNIMSVEAAKRVNFGSAYTEYDPQKAANYFQSALALPFSLDPRETANRYSDFTSKLVSGDIKNIAINFVQQQLEKATANQRAITEKTQNDPLLWMRLAIDEMNLAIVNNQNFDAGEQAIDKAIFLAPKRVEILQLKIQIDGYKKDWTDVAKTAEKIVSLNPYDPALKWQLAMALYLNGRVEEAVKAGDEAVVQGFHFTQLQQFAWYIQYYESKKDYARVAPLLEQAVALQPNEIGLYVDLAKAYAAIGDNDHARALAEQVIKSDPSQKAAMEAFIGSLK